MRFLQASKGRMKVGRIKDPLYRDSYLGLPHLPSSYLLRPLRFLVSGLEVSAVSAFMSVGCSGLRSSSVQGLGFRGLGFRAFFRGSGFRVSSLWLEMLWAFKCFGARLDRVGPWGCQRTSTLGPRVYGLRESINGFRVSGYACMCVCVYIYFFFFRNGLRSAGRAVKWDSQCGRLRGSR